MIEDEIDDDSDEFDECNPCEGCQVDFDTVEVYDDFYLCVECLVKNYQVLDWDNKQMRARIEQLEGEG